MQVDNRLLDDLARVASGAFGALSGVREEVEGRLKHQFERILADMDMVSREEFEAVKEMAAKARIEQETLEARVVALEAAVAGGRAKTAATPRTKAKPGGKSEPET